MRKAGCPGVIVRMFVLKARRKLHACFDCFNRAIASRRICHERVEQHARGVRDVVDRVIESVFVCLRWPREAAQLPHELCG